jgi:hypothetical protein
MAGVKRPGLEQTEMRDLPLYLTDPPAAAGLDVRRLMGSWSAVDRAAARHPVPSSAHYVMPFEGRKSTAAELSNYGNCPVFDLMVPLGRRRVADVLDAWWPGEARTGVVTLQRRLKLWPPVGDMSSGWEMHGRLRRLTPLHWVPVLVYLWGKHDGFMRITVTPQSRVLTSRRYFRLGNSIVEDLFGELANTPVDADGAAS